MHKVVAVLGADFVNIASFNFVDVLNDRRLVPHITTSETERNQYSAVEALTDGGDFGCESMILANKVETFRIVGVGTVFEPVAGRTAGLIEIGDAIDLPFNKLIILVGIFIEIADVAVVHYLHCDKNLQSNYRGGLIDNDIPTIISITYFT